MRTRYQASSRTQKTERVFEQLSVIVTEYPKVIAERDEAKKELAKFFRTPAKVASEYDEDSDLESERSDSNSRTATPADEKLSPLRRKKLFQTDKKDKVKATDESWTEWIKRKTNAIAEVADLLSK